MNFLSNAFSLNMLPSLEFGEYVDVRIGPTSVVPPDAESFVGHPDMAKLLSNRLSRYIELNRENLELHSGDILYVAQYRGPRLEPGTTELPEAAKISFYRVEVRYVSPQNTP